MAVPERSRQVLRLKPRQNIVKTFNQLPLGRTVSGIVDSTLYTPLDAEGSAQAEVSVGLGIGKD